MAESVDVSIRLDKDLKDKATELFNSLGMDLSTATAELYRQTLEHGGLPFEAKEPNEVTRRAIEDAEAGIGLSGPFSSVEELMASLDADD